jgi:copper chaperone CopZ
MTCGNCARGVERKLMATPGVAKAAVDLAGARATVEFDPAKASAESLAAAVRQLGYEASA